MATETERKFLVKDKSILALIRKMNVQGYHINQGYLSVRHGATVRVRRYNDTEAYLTIKGPSVNGSCDEYEYEIPMVDAVEMMERLPGFSVLTKTRYRVPVGNKDFWLDEYQGKLTGLLTVEVELDDIDEALVLPFWVGEEVTGQRKYHNDMLSQSFYDTFDNSVVYAVQL